MRKNKHSNNNHQSRNAESGNAFLFILIGIVLFASITFIMSRGMRTEGVSKISEREAALATADILAFSKKIENAVSRLRRNGCSESQLNFENDIVSGYVNTNAPSDDSCDIFGPITTLRYTAPQTSWNDATYSASAFYNEWALIGTSSINDVGTQTGSCASASCADLILLMPYVKKDLCMMINNKLGVQNGTSDAPRDSGINAVKFIGTFTHTSYRLGDEAGTSANLAGKPAGCYSVLRGSGDIVHHYYFTVLAR